MSAAVALSLQSGLPAVVGRYAEHGSFVAASPADLLATFGDRTHLLTINLSATLHNASMSVFAGVVATLALRITVDTTIGRKVAAMLPAG